MAKKTLGSNLDATILNLVQVQELIGHAVASNQPIGIEGPPGVGKSAIVELAAKKHGLRFEPLILSLCDPTDIGGFPVVAGGSVDRLPLGPIKAACDEACVLFLDELTMASPPVQGAAMRLIYERWAGDRKLHKDTRIVAAWNPPDQAAGGYEMALPLTGRLCKVKLHPTHDEVRAFFYNLGEEGSTLRRMAVDFAATTEVSADLIQIEPPAGAQASGRQWGAPRSWERGLRMVSAAVDAKVEENGQLFASALSGNIGDEQAAAFIAIRKVRTQLPSEKEIIADPMHAKLPSNKEVAIAALGLLAQVGMTDSAAAWIYGNRLEDEARMAVIPILTKVCAKISPDNKRAKEGQAAMAKIFRSVGSALGIDSGIRK